MGQGITASSAAGAVVEDPDMFARGIIFTAYIRDTGYIRFLDCYIALSLRWNTLGGII